MMPESRPSGGRVLLAEPDDEARSRWTRFLRHAGCDVLEAHDSDTALSLLSHDLVDFALIALPLPGTLSPEELLQRARQQASHTSIYILVEPGTMRMIGDTALTAADGCLSRQPREDELAALLGRMMPPLTEVRGEQTTPDRKGPQPQIDAREQFAQLAYGLVHDFNNLLTTILGLDSIILSRVGTDDPLRAPAEGIRIATRQGAGLLRRLLSLARPERSSLHLLDLNRVVGEVSLMLQHLAQEEIILTTQLEPSLGLVRAAEGQLERVVLNLLLNARAAVSSNRLLSRPGRILVQTANHIATTFAAPESGPPPGVYVKLTVSDNGCGMDADTRDRLFQPFFTTKAAEGGTGLGLATVAAVVRERGGHIDVASTRGAGTTFNVYWPSCQEARRVAPAGVPRSESPPKGSETILVAEDDERVRLLLREVLHRCGYTILEARDGEEALELCRLHNGPVHLLIADVIMPRMHGDELARRLRSQSPDLKVLYISGYAASEDDLPEGLEAHAAFLPKPFPLDVLERKVRAILDMDQE
jgi:signal transduction histidine kinase